MKKHTLLFLTNIHITILIVAMPHASLLNAARIVQKAPHSTRIIAIAILKSFLPEDPTKIIGEYLGRGRQWRPQIIQTSAHDHDILALSPEEYIVAYAKSGKIALFSPETGDSIRYLNINDIRSSFLNYSNDGKFLVIQSQNKIYVIDTATEKVAHRLNIDDIVSKAVLLKQNKLITSHYTKDIVKTWDVERKVCTGQIPFNSFFAMTLDGQLLATPNYQKKSVEIWMANNYSFDHTHTIKNINVRFNCLAFSQDNSQLAIGTEPKEFLPNMFCSTIDIRNLNTGKSIRKLRHYTKDLEAEINSIAYSPTGQLAAGTNKTISIWSPHGQLLKRLEIGTNNITHLMFSPEGSHLVFNSERKAIHIVDIELEIEAEEKKRKKKKDHCCIS